MELYLILACAAGFGMLIGVAGAWIPWLRRLITRLIVAGYVAIMLYFATRAAQCWDCDDGTGSRGISLVLGGSIFGAIALSALVGIWGATLVAGRVRRRNTNTNDLLAE